MMLLAAQLHYGIKYVLSETVETHPATAIFSVNMCWFLTYVWKSVLNTHTNTHHGPTLIMLGGPAG